MRGLGGRLANWTGVFGALDEDPGAIFTGFGYSMASPTGKMWNDGAYRRYTGHNIMLDVIAGTGVPGALLFIFGFAGLFMVAARGLAGPERRVHFLMLLALLYAFLSGVFGIPSWDRWTRPPWRSSPSWVWACFPKVAPASGRHLPNAECGMGNAE